MRRLLFSIALAGVAAIIVPNLGGAAEPFTQKLPAELQAAHALNRLSFGARPGDVEEVRRIGVAKWIEQQLNPGKIAENPTLEARLMVLQTLWMNPADIIKDYAPVSQPVPALLTVTINTLITGDDLRKVQNGTAEERVAVLKALDPDKRKQVLMVLPQQLADALPDYKMEATEARAARQVEIQKESRRLNPPLQDLLDADQLRAAQSGNKEQMEALFAYLEPDKRLLVAAQLPEQAMAPFPELRRESMKRRNPRPLVIADPKDGKILRAIHSNRQLEEVLVDFWYNHFNVDQNKNVQNVQNGLQNVIASYERDAIRPHVLGHFKDLLLATARHPAMLYYLDNWESMGTGSFNVGPFAPQRGTLNGVPNSIIPSPLSRLAHGLNENYGREIMELHTLGIKGGYTQDDVIAVARCLTGWTVRDPYTPEFAFAAFMHDTGEKTVLGHKIPAGGGEQDGVRAIEILARHPSTAKFISRKLAQRFVADDPPQSLVDRMAQTFTKTDGDLKAVLETMFTATEFFSEGAWQAKVKSPFEMIVSAVRAMGGDATSATILVQRIAELGQPLYSKLEPTGYPNTGELWLSSTGTMSRMSFAAAISSGLITGVKVDAARLQGMDETAIARELLGRDASLQTRVALKVGLGGKQRPPAFVASLVLGSPDFQRR